jgi:hypothetical protein
VCDVALKGVGLQHGPLTEPASMVGRHVTRVKGVTEALGRT